MSTADFPTMTTAEIRSTFLSFFEERGLKYLDLSQTRGIRLVARGRGAGVVEVSDDAGFSHLLGTVDVAAAGRTWADFAAPLEPAGPRSALYLRHRGGGRLDLLEFELLA